MNRHCDVIDLSDQICFIIFVSLYHWTCYFFCKVKLHINSTYYIRTSHRDVWENHRVENVNRLIKQVKLCLINIYKADWSNKARNFTKLRTYIQFTFDHSLEEYLFYIPHTRWMKALSRLRICSHMLEIERGRHVKPQKNTTRTAHMSKIKLCWWRNSL